MFTVCSERDYYPCVINWFSLYLWQSSYHKNVIIICQARFILQQRGEISKKGGGGGGRKQID